MDAGSETFLTRGTLTCHCLLLETDSGLVLCDTGFGLRDVADPKSRLSSFFLALVSPDFREEMTAVRQIERLGFSADDVRHIILTHLDFDHAGGLDDFPQAAVHLLTQERSAAAQQKTWLDRQRFRPKQWSSKTRWKVYDAHSGDAWNGFERVGPLEGLPPEILLIPLFGHTLGHAGIAIDRGDKWLLMAGDAYFFHQEMNLTRPCCTPGLQFYQWMMDKDRRQRKHNQQRLRELVGQEAANLELFCSHDVKEFERLSGRPVHLPAGP